MLVTGIFLYRSAGESACKIVPEDLAQWGPNNASWGGEFTPGTVSDRRSRPSLQDGESGESGEQAEAEQREESEAAADPALTLRVYAHAMRNDDVDLSFAEFGTKRPYTAPRTDEEFEEVRNHLKRLARREGFEPPTLRFEEESQPEEDQ